MRTAAQLRAEADQLRRSPFNTLSFHGVTDRSTDRWTLPVPTDDFTADFATGARLAAELVDAAQVSSAQCEPVHAMHLLMQLLERMDKRSDRRSNGIQQGLLRVLDMALATSLSGDELIIAERVAFERAVSRHSRMVSAH